MSTASHAHRTAPWSAVIAYAALNFRRMLRDWTNFVFNVVLPVLLFLIFGASQDIEGQGFPGGNIPACVMVGMALYAGVSAAVSTASSTVVENRSGWGRQLALTPLTPLQIVVAQALIILLCSVLSIAAVFAVGALTGAEMPWEHWVICFMVTCAVSLPFGFFGLVWMLAVPNENTIGIASTSVVILAFLGNLFLPLAEGYLELARYTPLYGAAALARWPVSDGYQVIKEAPFVIEESLWVALLNCGAWALIFCGAALLLQQCDKARL